MSGSAALQAAIGIYHDALTPELAQASAAWLDERLADRGLFFGDRALCTVIRPRFLTPEAYTRIREVGSQLARAFTRAHEAAVARPEVLAQFRLADWEHVLLADDDRQPWPSPLGRYDAFFGADGETLKFTENNAETPAGSAYGDVLTGFFLGLPAMAPFLERFEVRPLLSRPPLLHTMLAAWRAATGRRDRPVIGIIDWHEVPTQSEFREMQRWLAELGYRAIIADPRELEYRGGRLVSPEGPIDLVYKRILITELVGREGLAHPLVRAVRERAVVMVNPFRCKVLHKKASLAVLSDERNAALFDAEMRQAIARHVPWTRVVEARETEFEGRRVDLLPFLARHRERFVLKPNDDYGGTGIVLGWETDDATWTAALARATEAPHIAQERIHLPEEAYPSVVDGRLVLAPRIVDTAPYVFGGSWVEGCLSRISTATLVNVTAGGGSTIPTFVVSPR